VENEGEFEGNVNTCRSGWVWDGTQIENNLASGYWYQEVPCPEISSIRLIRPLSRVEFRVSSLKGALQVESHTKTAISVYNIDGNRVLKFDAPAGESIVPISLIPGIYIVKNINTKKAQKVLIK